MELAQRLSNAEILLRDLILEFGEIRLQIESKLEELGGTGNVNECSGDHKGD